MMKVVNLAMIAMVLGMVGSMSSYAETSGTKNTTGQVDEPPCPAPARGDKKNLPASGSNQQEKDSKKSTTGK